MNVQEANEEYTGGGAVGFEDLAAMDEELEIAAGPATIRTGMAKSIVQTVRRQDGFNPNAVRYLFNPFEVIDCTNLSAPTGFLYLPNIYFQEVKSIPTKVIPPDPFDLPKAVAAPGSLEHEESTYVKVVRSAWAIASEMVEQHGDKGVIIVQPLTGQEDEETVAAVNQTLFGEEVACIVDVHNPDFPCPVLPLLLENMEVNYATFLKENHGTAEAELLGQVAKLARTSLNLAIRNARARIADAQKRIMEEKNPNRTYSPAEQRCFLALGEEVPNQTPFVTKSMAAAVNGSGIDPVALGRGIAEGFARHGVQPVAEAPQKAVSTIPNVPTSMATGGKSNAAPAGKTAPSFDVDETDIEEVETQTGKPNGNKKK